MTGNTDARAIARSLNEPERFEVVFDRHFAAVHRYLKRRVGTELAQELAAETFLQAFKGRRRFAGEDALPWLYGIAAQSAADEPARRGAAAAGYSRVARLGPDRSAPAAVRTRLHVRVPFHG